MTGTGESLLKRCLEGHVFDAARHETCPTCGSPAAGKGRSETADNAQEEPPAETTVQAETSGTTGAGQGPRTEARRPGLPSALKGVRGLALIGGLVGAALLVVAVLTARDDAPSSSVADAPEEVETPQEEPEAPAVFSRQDEEPAPAAAADDFNPSTADPYGLWEMYTPTVNQGPFRHVIEIRPNGSYTVYAGPYSHAGSMTFAGRTYLLHSRTSAYQDGGAFFRPDPDGLVFEGRLGRSVWARVREPSLFDLAGDGIQLPSNLPKVLERMSKHIRATWRNDAVAVMFEVERSRHGAYELKVSFLSPQDQTGLSVTWSRFHSNEFEMGGVNWFDKPLPEAFVDLPEAYAALGAVGPIKRASLGYFNRGGGGGDTYDRAAPPGWLILPEAGQGGLVEGARR